MSRLLLGNLLSLIGAAVMVSAGLLKTRSHILIAQCLQYGILSAGNLVLGGVSGALSNCVSIARNLICLKHDFTVPLKIIFTVLLVVISFFSGFDSLVSLLPFAAACMYTWFLDTKSERVLKTLIIITQVCWILYDYSIQNYVALLFDVFTIISNIIGIFMLKHSAKAEK